MKNEKKKWKIADFQIWNNWPEIFFPKKYNWCGFNLIHIYGEYDLYGPVFCFDCVILGLGFSLSIGLPWETVQSQEIKKIAEDAKKHPEKLIPIDPDYLNYIENSDVE